MTPLDVGALLTHALSLTPLSAADLARLTGIAPSNISRALRSPDTRPTVARRILAALGASLTVQMGDGQEREPEVGREARLVKKARART